MGEDEVDLEGAIGAVPTCKTCGTQRVVRDAWACWNPASGLWELENVFDHSFCHQCEGDTSFRWIKVEAVPNLRIRELNDQMRKEGRGHGSYAITAGIWALGKDFVLAAVRAVEQFDGFDDNNDPWGEHDFGSMSVQGETVYFKFDYYSLDLQLGSENPANEGVTHRVMTIMLASEY